MFDYNPTDKNYLLLSYALWYVWFDFQAISTQSVVIVLITEHMYHEYCPCAKSCLTVPSACA